MRINFDEIFDKKSSKMDIYKICFWGYNNHAVGGTNSTASRTTNLKASDYQSYDNKPCKYVSLCFLFFCFFHQITIAILKKMWYNTSVNKANL